MSASTVSLSTALPALEQDRQGMWLRNRRWDMIFIIISVLVVPLPYIFYLLGTNVLNQDADGVRSEERV